MKDITYRLAIHINNSFIEFHVLNGLLHGFCRYNNGNNGKMLTQHFERGVKSGLRLEVDTINKLSTHCFYENGILKSISHYNSTTKCDNHMIFEMSPIDDDTTHGTTFLINTISSYRNCIEKLELTDQDGKDVTLNDMLTYN